jgi:serine/threonine-protein kinase
MNEPITAGGLLSERYELLEPIGQGGMGIVWRALDRATGQIVAIKFLNAFLSDDASSRERFQREIDLARRVESPRVARMLDHGMHGSVPFLVMEHVDGRSLRDLAADHGRYSWDEARPLLVDIARALADVHAAGVIHRDIKPSNVLVLPDGRIKLADFGIARAFDQSRLTGSATMLGTPAYLAPEGARDERSDLYALGVLGYELLAGVPPFTGDTTSDVVMAHVRTAPDLNRLPKAARPVVGWLLEKDPARRPANAWDLLASLGGGDGPATVRREVPRRRSRSRWLPLAAVPAVLVVGLALLLLRNAAGAGQADGTAPTAASVFTGAASPVRSLLPTPSLQISASAMPSQGLPGSGAATLPGGFSVPASLGAGYGAGTGSTSPAQITPAATETLGLPYSGTAGAGAIEVDVAAPTGPQNGVYVEVHLSKTDAQGAPVPGDTVTGQSTDNSGATTIELPPGRFIVLANLPGYPWGNLTTADGLSDVAVLPGQLTRIVIQLGSITFAATKVDGVAANQYVEMDLQQMNALGKPVEGGEVASGTTANTGTFSASLTPGAYVVKSSFTGYNWGDLSDAQGTTGVTVVAGKDTAVNVRLGRIRVGTVANSYVEVDLQTTAASGSPAAGAEVASGNTDNTGYWSTDLTAGTYVVKFAGRTLYNIAVGGGQVANVK